MSNLATVKNDPQSNLKALLSSDKVKSALKEVLPKHVTADRLVKVVLSCAARTPKILECDQTSVLRAVMQSAELGLEIGGLLGEAYLVPFKRKWKDGSGRGREQQEAQCIIGYQGLMKLARQSGEVASIYANVVYENDRHEVDKGNNIVKHWPELRGEPGEALFVYAVAILKSGERVLEVMTRRQVNNIRAKSKASDNGPWVTDTDEMWRKTALRRLCKYVPRSAELTRALEQDIIDTVGDDVTDVTSLTAGESAPAELPATRSDDLAKRISRPKKEPEAAPVDRPISDEEFQANVRRMKEERESAPAEDDGSDRYEGGADDGP